jgi:HlyD family secretion protein
LKKLLLILVPALLVVVVVAGFVMGSGEEDAVRVQTATADWGELSVTVTAPGSIRADKRVSISARTSARVVALPFEEGDVVEQNAVLVQLDDIDAQAQVRSAQAQVRQAEAGLAVAKARLEAARAQSRVNEASLNEAVLELERQQSLLETSDTSRRLVEAAAAGVERLRAQVEVDRLQLRADEKNLQALEAGVEAARAGTERAQQTLEDTVIRSPIAGTVTKLNAEVGEVVVVGTMNNAGTVIMEVADLSTMICVAEVDEASITSVNVGQPATVRSSAYDDLAIPGTVRSVALAKSATVLSDETNYYEVEISLDLDDVGDGFRRLSGLTSDVEIVVEQLDRVLVVPSQAVVGRRVDSLSDEARESDALDDSLAFAPVVYRIRDGLSIAVPVQVGESDLLHTVVEAGLAEGDDVVVGPFNTLDDLRAGVPLRVEDE